MERNGKTFGDDYVQLPDDIIVEWSQDFTKNAKKISSRDNSIANLIRQVFSKLEANCTSADYMHEHAILSTTNEHVDAMNAIMIERFPGNEKVYYSFDSVDDDTRNNYPLDFLNSITPNGLPPPELKVKKDCPVSYCVILILTTVFATALGWSLEDSKIIQLMLK